MFAIPTLELAPLVRARGTVHLPGSKSISNRVLLLAALCEGVTRIDDLLDSDDTRVMLDALAALGCELRRDGASLWVTGLGGRAPSGPVRLHLGNAGTAMRPLTAALALMGGNYELSGVARMHERPIGDLVQALLGIGARIEYLGHAGFPPLRIGQPNLCLEGPVRVRGDVSSQFLTALLLALPLRARDREVVVEVDGTLISKPYVQITLALLARFGIDVQRDGWQRFTIAAGSRLRSPGQIAVEADASSASYFIALGAIAGVGEDAGDGITIRGVGDASIQGDVRFIDAARAMGARIDTGPNWLRVRRGAWPLKAIDLDANAIPDAAMTLAPMALYADGPCTIRNIASWRVKETDRIAALARECARVGAEVASGPDWLRVSPPTAWRAATFDTYDDHRMAMCLSLTAFNPPHLPQRINDPGCVAKTFPDYFETFFSVSEAAVGGVPVICIDGPTASGKGTLASALAHRLGWHHLDSGALYRATALAARRAALALTADNETAVAAVAADLQLRFDNGRVWLNGEDVSDAIRTEAAGADASTISAWPAVRAALLDLQRRFRRLPGLVADGRDMGTVVFPDAPLKVFLTAGVDQRAQRRHKQLISKGISANISDVRADLLARDLRDSTRSSAPLKPADDAKPLDNSASEVSDTVALVLDWWRRRAPFGPGPGG